MVTPAVNGIDLFKIAGRSISEQAKTIIQRIRSSPPSRLVRGAAGNASGRYPSKKMGCTIQFESHRGELAFIYQLEHDPAVLEFYDQLEPIKLTYQGKTGRQVGLFYTPDFFVLREDGGGWVNYTLALTLEEEPDLLQQWKYCYERSIGCVGVLKDWLTRALAEAIERRENTISPSLLEQHALSVDRCTQMVTEAATGETALTEDDQAAYRLRVRLGLETGPAGQQEQHLRPQPTPRRGLRVGQRKPTRDPVATVTWS